MTNYVPSQHQHPSSHTMIVMIAEAVHAQVTKRYMVGEGMRGSWNMHPIMTCLSVACTPKKRNSHLITYRSGNTNYVVSKVLVQACY